jgi:site-specific DNA recombinase
VHKGEHPAIVDREVFERVQAMLSERSVARSLKRGNSPHLLTGLIFDDRGNPMSPTHANKKGVRYRYYTSHALLRRRKEHAGSVPRVSAPEVEALICKALRREMMAVEEAISDRELVAAHVSNVIVRRSRIEVELQREPDREEAASELVIPFTPLVTPQKGIACEPAEDGRIDAVARENLLNAIRRAFAWVEAMKSGQAKSFTEIAAREGLGRRHVRRLAVLPFLAPKVLEAVAAGTAPAALTVSLLTEALPHCWAEQEIDNFGQR